ncbi:hypothetical protein [Gordoniibacillus kamchatkensis]|uniref:hypothetical protein n=1 Tax=Gordoniibacillus kamchatkensis TaxID=1590651 RepID=UPI000695EE21|nr:hypothetical protein [Paenibacillus sp. VKM B-2647]
MFRSKPLLLLTICSLIAAGGCSTSRYHNADGSVKAQNYPTDGYMGLTSANPNDPMNPTHHHYRDDFRMMHQVIARIPGVQDSAINVNGPHARIDLELKKGTSQAEATRIRDQAYHALSQSMPRYIIEVTTSIH